VNTANVPQSRIDALISGLRSNGVERVEILQIPARILTRARVTPDILERSFHYKLTIRGHSWRRLQREPASWGYINICAACRGDGGSAVGNDLLWCR